MNVGGLSYQVARPTRQCAATGRAIEPGERFVATLVEVPDVEEMARLDFSEAAWAAGARPAPPLAMFGHWRSVLDAEERPVKQLLDDEELLDLFEQLGESEDEKRLAFRFVLALALIRKRLLTYEGGQPANAKTGEAGLMRVRRRGAEPGDVMEVIDPGMDDEAVDAATEQIGQIMNLDQPAPGKRGRK